MSNFGNPWGVGGDGIDTTKLYDIPKTIKSDWTEAPTDSDWQYKLRQILWTANVDTLSPLNSVLVSYWKAEDLTDSFGNHVLTNNGAVTFTAGKNNNAFTFSGSNWLNATSGSDFAFGTNDFTIAFWMYSTDLSTYRHMWDSRTSDADIAGFSIGTNASGVLTFWTNNAFQITGATTLSTSTWYHVVLSVVSGVHTLYLNATSDGTYTNATADYTNNICTIGQYYLNNGSYRFVGSIDEFCLWNGHGMSSSEVSALYNSGTGAFLL